MADVSASHSPTIEMTMFGGGFATSAQFMADPSVSPDAPWDSHWPNHPVMGPIVKNLYAKLLADLALMGQTKETVTFVVGYSPLSLSAISKDGFAK